MYLRDYWKRKNNTTKWNIFLQNVLFLEKAYRMKKPGTIRKSKEYSLKQEITSIVEEPAVKYKSLNVILGGKQSISQPVSGDFDLIALTREGIRKSSLKSLAAFAQRGIDVTGSKEAFIEWLHSPLVSLKNKRPLEFLDTTFGIQLLEKLLGRLEQGVYS